MALTFLYSVVKIKSINSVRCFKYIICVLCISLPVVDSLLCYQCASGSKDGGDCMNDYDGLMKSARTDINSTNDKYTGIYTKDCSEIRNRNKSQDFCVIETFKSAGDVKSYIRDCSDGQTFSYTGTITNLAKLENLPTNNFTTCTYHLISNVHICITLCDSDFCNGPVVVANNTNCTEDDNATCSASRLGGHFGSVHSLLSNPLVPVTVAYILMTLILV